MQKPIPFKPIAIIGTGSWGTALALYLGRRGQAIRMWSIDPSEIVEISTNRCNQRYLPGYELPETIQAIEDLSQVVKGIEDILIVVPSVGFRHVLCLLKPVLEPTARIICATKGLDADTGQLLNEVCAEVLGKDFPFAVLSGPSFAREVAAGLPTAVMIASRDLELAGLLAQRFNSEIFHIQTSEDVSGVEICSVIKNVIAIATGIADGMNLGSNARSTLITYGLAEMIHLGRRLGGELATFIGLAGLGDLILTCSDNQSRNHRLGYSIGQGEEVAVAEKTIGQVVEGKRNAELVMLLAKEHQLELPVCHMVFDILQGTVSAPAAIKQLLNTGIQNFNPA